MSNARSPRDVCSTTMGISGLISASAPYRWLLIMAWGPEFRCLRRLLLLLRRPDRFARLVELRRDRLHLGNDAIEGALQAEVVAYTVGAALLDELVDILVALARLPQLGPDLVVGDLDPELVGDGLEHQLARDGQRRLGPE